jgi:hypothetical protein
LDHFAALVTHWGRPFFGIALKGISLDTGWTNWWNESMRIIRLQYGMSDGWSEGVLLLLLQLACFCDNVASAVACCCAAGFIAGG